MTDTSRPTVYSTNQMIAHWLVAFLIVFQFLSSGGMVGAFDASVEEGASILSGPAIVHGGIGLAIFGVMIWRLTLRLRHGTPPPPETEATVVQYLSRGVHYAFYITLLAMPLAGLSALLSGSEAIATAHALASKLLIALAVLHIAGALWHLTKGDGVVHRMIRRDPARTR